MPWETMFADDVLLFSGTREEFQNRFEIWRKILEERGMKITQRRPSTYALGEKRTRRNIKPQDIDVPKANAFKYLGSIVQDDGGEDIEIGRRIGAAWHGW